MPVENVEIAAAFDEVADLLEITGAGYFRVRAYRNASRVIRDLSTPLHRMVADPDFKPEDLPGIGRDLAGKVREMLDTGDLAIKRELEEQLPPGILEVTKVAGIGPRKAHTLFLELGVGDLESLGEAARDGRVRELKGFGPKTEANIMEGIFALKELGRPDAVVRGRGFRRLDSRVHARPGRHRRDRGRREFQAPARRPWATSTSS